MRRTLAALAFLGWASVAQADDEAIRSRIAALTERAERAGASELLEQASRALLASDRLRVQGDPEGAARAEAIAEAAVVAVERRVEAHRARSDRDAARARWQELSARAARAQESLERARAERARLERGEAPPATVEAAPEGE